MKSLNLIIIFLLGNLGVFAQNKNEEIFSGCATDQLMHNNTALRIAQKDLDAEAYKYFTEGKNKVFNSTTTVSIAVVVHIIHNGGTENISDAQVQTAIANLNAKFAQSNNYQIQFCLAQRDPQGNSTTGITRNVSSLTTETMEVDDIALKNIDRWTPTCYLNIWVVKEILSQSMGSSVVGYAYLPSAHGSNTDGVVIEANYFGNSSTNDAVITHELGHYFGLYHTFQNGCNNNNCLLDGDQVCDTPPDQTTFATCVPPSNSCNTDANDPSANNPFNNDIADYSDDYMDYSDLSCYTKFTAGQYSRMQYYLTTIRSSLLTCLGCMTPCPTPLTATINTPGSTVNIVTGTGVSFSGTVTNSSNYQWYITPGVSFSTGLSSTYTFNSSGSYWVKFRAISSNPTLCLDALDSVLVIVTQPVVTSCAGSLKFDNINDAVHLPDNNQYYSSNGFTWECWFKLTSPIIASTQIRSLICSIDNVVYEDIYLGFGWPGAGYAPADHLVFRVDGPNSSTGPNANGCNYVPPGGFQLATWYHVAGVMNYVTHTADLYLNGQLVDTKFVNSVPFTRIISSELSWDESTSPGYVYPPLGGNMDEVRMWSSPRTASQIAASYNQCMAGNEQNLLLYYRCNQSAGSTAIDATANGNDGTLANNAAWSTQEPALIGTTCSTTCIEICGNGIDDNYNGQIDEGCSCPVIIASNDTSICPGSSAQLNASAGFNSYTWMPNSGLNNNSIQNPIATPTVTTNYFVTGTTLGPNQVVNADFSAGNFGFTSGHTYSSAYSPCNYYVANTFFTMPDPTLIDHTPTADGMYMSIDGCSSSATVLWEQTILGIQPNTNYKFAFWATKADQVQPTFEIHMIGNITGNNIEATLQGIPYTGVWTWDEYGIPSWNSGPNTNVTIQIVNLETNGSGNDFGMDDFVFQKNCISSDTVKIIVNGIPPTLNLGNDITLCTSGTHTFNAGAGFKEYLWNDGDIDPTYTAYGPGKYWVTVKDSCGGIQSDTVFITLSSSPILDLNSNASPCNGDSILLGYTTNVVFTSYQWTPGTGLSCVNCPHPYAKPSVPTMYYLSATTAEGCTSIDSIDVTVVSNMDPDLAIPNIFTPNGDGINDVFKITNSTNGTLNCKIYDRWGILVGELMEAKGEWDGRTTAGIECSSGVYFYIVSGKDECNGEFKKTGFVQLIK